MKWTNFQVWIVVGEFRKFAKLQHFINQLHKFGYRIKERERNTISLACHLRF